VGIVRASKPGPSTMSDGDREKVAKVYEKLASTADAFSPATCVVMVIDPDNAHVQVSVPGTEDPRQIYEAGQKALFALSKYLELFEPGLAADARRKAQQS
jgi:hypothetical protein